MFGSRVRWIAALSIIALTVSGSPAGAAPPREPSPAPPPVNVLRTPPVKGRALAAAQPAPSTVLPDRAEPVKATAIPPAERVKELTGERTATTKTYKLADGRTQSEVSREPVHYRDAGGKWQDIDTRATPSKGAGFPYAAAKNAFGSAFGDRSDRLLRYQTPGGHGLTMGLDAAATPVKPAVTGSRVTYRGAADGADLVYEVTKTAVKEQIVLAKAPRRNTWTFTLALDKVRAVPQADGSIAFHATDRVGPALFTLPKPYMYDSSDDPDSVNGKGFSGKVTQTVSQAGARIRVTVTADAAWLRDPARRYPVVVDPTIKVQPTLSQAQDVFIDSSEPTTNYDNVWKLSTGVNTGGRYRSLTRFDLGHVPSGTTLDSAQLQMYYDQVFGDLDNYSAVYEARRATASWVENTATWNSMNANVGEVGENREQVDEADAGKVTRTGEWPASTNADRSRAINGAYRYNAGTGGTSPRYTWVPRVTEEGTYEVFTHYVPGTNRSKKAPYTISFPDRTVTRYIDQSTGSGNGQWVSLGSYAFKPGTTQKVSLGAVSGEVVVADAIRLVKRGEATKPKDVTNAWHTFSVRNIVQDWLNGAPNYGFMVKAKDETQQIGGPRYESGDYSYGGEDDHGPKLLLTWGRTGVAPNPVTTVRSTGAELSWNAYADPSSSPDDDITEYQVHASKVQNFLPSAATLIAPVRPGRTSYTDTRGTPGEQLFYMIAVRTRDGTVIPSPTEMVKLAAAGQVIKFFGGAEDNTLTSAKPTSNWDVLDAGGELQAGNKGSTYGNSRIVVKFPDLGGLPANAKVLDAKLGLWAWYAEGAQVGSAQYQLRALTRDFSETTSTWNSAQSGTAWSTAGGDVESTVHGVTSGITADPPGWTQWTATPLVQRWIDTPSTNKGALIKVADEAGSEQRTLFLSAEAEEPTLRPRLRVVYTAPDSASTYAAPDTPARMVPGDEYLVPVTLTNTTREIWSAADWVLSYHWQRQDGTDVPGVTPIETPLPSTQAPGGVVTVTSTVKAPAGGADGDRRNPYVLTWELRNKTTGKWLSQTSGIEPLDQDVAVEDPTSDQLGLEKFYHYAGGGLGAGATAMINQFSGNAVVGYNPINNPSLGVSTFVRLTYNSQDATDSGVGDGWSLSTSSTVRLGSPLEFYGGTDEWPQQVAMTDGDGTTHVFDLDRHNSTNTADWRYIQPSGVHMYLQQTGSGDSSEAWTLTRPDRSQFVFDEDGYQRALRDRNGNTLDFTYEQRTEDNRPVSVLRYLTDPAGRRTLTLDYYTEADGGHRDGQVKRITDVSGRTLDFTYDDDGFLTDMADGADKHLTFSYDDDTGRLERITDPRRNSSRLAYDDDGKVASVTDRGNRTMYFEYADPDGEASAAVTSKVTDQKGRITENEMDPYGRVVRISDPKRQITQLAWDADNNVIRAAEPSGAVTTWRYDQLTGLPLELRDPEANKNNTPGTKVGYQFGLAGHTADLTEKVTPEGRRWTFAYDTVGNLTSVTDPKGVATATAGDYTSSYTYDTAGRMLTSTDANDNVTRFGDYEANGYPQTVTDALEHATRYTYNAIGETLTTTDAANNTATYTYDGYGRPLTTRIPKDTATGRYITTPAPVYDKNDNVTQATSPTGAVSTATYDKQDRSVTVVAPKDTATSAAPTTTYEYDQVGNVTRVTSPRGNLTPANTGDFSTSYVYNELDQAVEAVDALGGRASVTYDIAGDVVAQYDQRKNKTTDTTDYSAKLVYDLNHRLIRTIDAKGNSTTQAYDRDGNAIETVDQDGNRSTTRYDERGYVVERTAPYQGTATRTVRMEYDEVGNQTRMISPRGVETTDDPDDFATLTLFDKLNRASEVQQPYDKDDVRFKTPAVTRYTYDVAGNLERISAPPSGGQTTRNDTVQTYFSNGWVKTSQDVAWNMTTTYDYDDNGAQTSRKLTAPGAATREMTWTYFPDGKQRGTDDNGAGSATPGKHFRFAYDVNANLTQVLDSSDGAKVDEYAVAYDGLDRVASIEERDDGEAEDTSTFEYEPNDLLKRLTHDLQITTYTYEAERDLVTGITSAEKIDDPKPKNTTYAYDKRGLTTTETKGNNNVVTTDYYLDGSVRSSTEKKSGGTVVNQHTYEYTANGQKSKEVQHKQNSDNKSAYLDTTSTYVYDPVDRVRTLTKTGAGADTEQYVHDDNSNVVTQTVDGKTTNFTYDRNRLTSASVDGQAATYAYDPYGRLKTISGGGIELESYTYDGFDHVVKHVKNPGGKATEYTYDPLDRMASRKYAGKTTAYAYLGLTADVAAELENDKIVKTYQRDPSGNLLSQVSIKDDGSREDSYTGYDGQSDIDQITDDKGDGRATYGYTAYGKADNDQFTGADKAQDAQNPDNPDQVPYNSYRFQGKRYDQASGDYDMGFRDYDPGINQFLSRDSYNGALDDLGLAVDPYTGSRYGFAGGNPISNVELDGHNWLSDAAGAVGEFVSAAASHVTNTVKETANTYAEMDDCSSGDSEAACDSLKNKAKGLLDLFGQMEDCGMDGNQAACGQVEEAAGCGEGTSGATCAGNLAGTALELFVSHKIGGRAGSRPGGKTDAAPGGGAKPKGPGAAEPRPAGGAPAPPSAPAAGGTVQKAGGAAPKTGGGAPKPSGGPYRGKSQNAPGGQTGPAVSIKQVRQELGQAGMSVSKYDIEHVPHIEGPNGFPAYGQSPHTNGLPWRGSSGRPLIEISDRGLASLDEAVTTVFHEIYHHRSYARGSGPGPESVAEAYGQRMLGIFQRRR
jgi:RHS repeat-associated protein